MVSLGISLGMLFKIDSSQRLWEFLHNYYFQFLFGIAFCFQNANIKCRYTKYHFPFSNSMSTGVFSFQAGDGIDNGCQVAFGNIVLPYLSRIQAIITVEFYPHFLLDIFFILWHFFSMNLSVIPQLFRTQTNVTLSKTFGTRT